MNSEKLMELLVKGFDLIDLLKQVTEKVTPAINAIWELIEKHKSGVEITNEELARVEGILDELLADFNEPLPDE